MDNTEKITETEAAVKDAEKKANLAAEDVITAYAALKTVNSGDPAGYSDAMATHSLAVRRAEQSNKALAVCRENAKLAKETSPPIN